jgi:hypothetical protein
MAYRDHEAIVLEQFNGLFDRGDKDAVPLDHFTDCENIQFIHEGFTTRDGLDTYRAIDKPVRIYNYVMQAGESLLILDTNGSIWHSINETITHGPILTIPEMTDFGFVSFAGRAYITPFKTETNPLGVNYQRGLQNEFVYVYKGDGTPARKAGGTPPVGTLSVAPDGAGHVDMGIHIIGVAYETDTGFITQIAGFAQVTTDGAQSILVSGIPISSDTNVIARRLVSTVAIDPAIFTGDLKGYQFFYVKRIPDNTTTTITLDFYDSELISDASHLLDILPSIPAAVGLTVYHNRLVSWAEYNNISMLRVSYVGEPEAMDAVSGILIFPLDGNPITNAQEYRDVLYVFKKTRTAGWTDTGDVPTSWPFSWLDQGIGASVHGIGTVLDSGGVNIDFLLIVDYSGLMLFNGAYARPELSWKIRDLWFNLARNDFGNIQIMNDSLSQVVYITLPSRKMLYADYSNGLDADNIKWSKWRFDVQTTTITLVETNKLIIGSEGVLETPVADLFTGVSKRGY